jgi:predicted amidohydrolase YtcJ
MTTGAAGGPGPGKLVIEHALLAPAQQRARAVRLGIPITVQHALLWNMGSEMVATWGEDRTREVNPLDEWLDDGATLAAGTDIVRPFNPLTNLWDMVTRRTKTAGAQGVEHGIPRDKAIELHRSDRPGPMANPTGAARSVRGHSPTSWPTRRIR